MLSEAKRRIFIIDDDISVRKAFSRLLRSVGYQVETFPSGEQFLSRERFDGKGCIILDIQMPGLSGLALQQELCKADYHLPIIFVTGHGDTPARIQAMQRGAVDFISKPCDDGVLLHAVDIAFGGECRE
jgi:FixJ family two-component response regulator